MAYLPLSTANLPDPAIDPAQGSSPQDYFNTVTYTGTGSTRSVSGVGHQPDFLWIKSRSGATVHVLYDVLRGGTNALRSNTTDAEAQYADGVITFETDGFEIAGSSVGGINGSGESLVAWNWKANGSGVTNTDGSITSTVSANTESGFSIVQWTGNTDTASTVGHGLEQAPDMIIVKGTSTTESWYVYHSALGLNKYLRLETTNASATATNLFGTVNSTVFKDSYTGTGGIKNIAYCFHSVEGFSKAFSYTGNGSADGSFVYLGFKPAFVIFKAASTTGNWKMHDVERGTYNANHPELLAESSAAEAGSTGLFDLLSNGIKLRTTSQNYNQSGVTYIGIAFASNPFKYSTAR